MMASSNEIKNLNLEEMGQPVELIKYMSKTLQTCPPSEFKRTDNQNLSKSMSSEM